jgi:hypothetical protein
MPPISIEQLAAAASIAKRMESFGNGVFAEDKADVIKDLLHSCLIEYQESGGIAACRKNGRFAYVSAAYDCLLREGFLEESKGQVIPTERLIESLKEYDDNI